MNVIFETLDGLQCLEKVPDDVAMGYRIRRPVKPPMHDFAKPFSPIATLRIRNYERVGVNTFREVE